MLEQLLSEARNQTERSDPPVKAAALLHLARVWTAFDQVEAERLLETGITLAFEIPPASDALRSVSITLAAAVSPQHALRLMPLLAGPSPGRAATIIFNMLRHGHLADAVSYLSDPPSREQYPYTAATEAIRRSRNDEESQRSILRGAIRARLGESGSSAHGFDMLFALGWSLLPAEEAKAAVRNIVQRIVEDPDGQTQSRFSKDGSAARFSSIRESSLFGIFGVVRQLDAELADSLCFEYPQLGAAVVAFPQGYHTEFAARRAKSPPEQTGAQCEQPDYITVGHSRLLPIPEALRTEFREPFEEALRLYALDTDSDNPNQAPRECWPSAMEFRNILFKAGQHEGRGAARYLDRIPDRDLRLFAQIELVAGVAGLPQFGGITIPPRPRPRFPPMERKDRWMM